MIPLRCTIPSAYNDPEPQRLPFILLNGRDHPFPNVIIVGRRIRNISSETCDSPKQVRARHNPNKCISAHNGQTLDVLTFHQLHNILKQHVFCRDVRIQCHYLPNLATLLMHELGRRPGRTHEKLEPSASLSLRPDLAAANEIAFRNNPDQLASFPNHGKATKVLMQHQVCSFEEGVSAFTVITLRVIIWCARITSLRKNVILKFMPHD
jgi:hypothetical protein